jgi:RNA polymerase sigma factor (sigma-70 family)
MNRQTPLVTTPDPGDLDVKPATYIPGQTASWNNSWSRFYEHFQGVILAYARKQGLNEHSARDVVQEVMVTLIRAQRGQAAGYDPRKGNYRSWLWGVIHHRMDSVRRLDRKQDPRDPQPVQDVEDAGGTGRMPVVSDPERAADELEARNWERAILEAAMEQVRASAPVEKFAIFTALLQEESSPEELAREHGLSRNNIDAIKHRYKNKVIEQARVTRAEWEQLRET